MIGQNYGAEKYPPNIVSSFFDVALHNVFFAL